MKEKAHLVRDLQALRERTLEAFKAYLQDKKDKASFLFSFENWLEEVAYMSIVGDKRHDEAFKEILTFLKNVAEKDKELFFDLVSNKLFIEELISLFSKDYRVLEVKRKPSGVKAEIFISLDNILSGVFFEGFIEFSISYGRIIAWVELSLLGSKNAGKLGYVFSWNELRWLKPFVISN
ncbi:hypothetical protein JCM14244_16600 [Venenivibrio stagnispumantis]|uniref:Uncharacterized protein n=1 Tax=Venenivibrio stagnispumantis TaxID=407998 RepID=A0AA46AFQ4_9AQUI|nr:hypothetical protein [Venenivibrio stagnispumantis]MCW4573985.1 hypothetical protein [Venenivibrio stagnispumantis]SMP21030.1 hypothetical protein SAMN06264868_1222 [Venenivibrio stagnispumantis]